MSRFAQKAVALGSALTLAMSLVGSAFAADPTPTTSTVVQQTTQAASNTAIVIQTGSATSGAAVAGPGSTAKSGEATTALKADVTQNINQQATTSGATAAVAGSSNTVAASTTQAASNTANLQQTGASSSGPAVATGRNAEATSGKASATADASQSQSIDQSAKTQGNDVLQVKGTTLAASSTTQLARNEAVDFQTVVAASGAAVAIGRDATAESGKATAKAKLDVDQSIDQDAIVKATNVLGAGTGAIAAQSATQVATNIADAAQLSAAISGPAVAIVVDGVRIDGLELLFVRNVEAESGDAESFVDTDQTQDIHQFAGTFASMFGTLSTTGLGGATGALAATGATQLASNTSIVFQTGIAASGAAAATQIDGGTTTTLLDLLINLGEFGSVSAESGEGEVHLFVNDDQSIDQDAVNRIDQDLVLGAIALSTAGVLQIENNFNCVPPQSGTAVSGSAIAIGDKFGESIAQTGEAEIFGKIDKDQGKVDPQVSSLTHWQILALEWPLFIGFGL